MDIEYQKPKQSFKLSHIYIGGVVLLIPAVYPLAVVLIHQDHDFREILKPSIAIVLFVYGVAVGLIAAWIKMRSRPK